jgi:hypothetical protein
VKPVSLLDPQARRLLDQVRSGIDPDARFTLAERLLATDKADERAELILLSRRITLSSEASLARRCLELLAKIGMGWLENDDEECILPAEGGGCAPVQYDLDLDDFQYYVRYRHGGLSISETIGTILDFYQGDYNCLERRYTSDGGEWTDEETNVLLFEISNALRIQRPHERLPADWKDHPHELPIQQLSLTLPEGESMRNHPRFRKGPYPRYVAPGCGRCHQHELSCFIWTVRAFDRERFCSLERLLPR